MFHNLKALGLAMVAAFAMSSVMASAASAVEFHSEAKHTTVIGEQIQPTKMVFEAGTLVCTGGTYNRTQEGETTSEGTIESSLSGCTMNGGALSATVSMNGCAYVSNSGEKEESGYGFLVDIECPEGKVIEINATSLGVKKCTITITPQGKRTKKIYTNKTTGKKRDLVAHIHLHDILYHQHEGSGFGACKSGTWEGGTEWREVTTTGLNLAKEQVGIWVE